MKNILTVFSGRRKNLEILVKYLIKALELKILDEVHFWNNTRISDDDEYIRTISNLKRSSSNKDGRYIQIFTPILNNQFCFNVIASNNIHIKINDNNKNIEYELILGGYDNTKSVIKKDNVEIYNLIQNDIANSSEEINIIVSITDNILKIYKNNNIIISCEIEPFIINDIYFKTGHNSVGDFNYKTIKNDGFYFMDTCEKSWKNYYTYYDNPKFVDDIIIKCDDDIVFIDLFKLPKFIEFVKNNDYDLVFANTINNGVSAYYQQYKFNLIPKTLMDFEYPYLGCNGTLWESGIKAEGLHNYFIDNYLSFLNYDYKNEIIPITTRFSINFFAYKGKDWYKIRDCSQDDEGSLTVNYVENRQFKNILYSDFYVSHLSFYKQLETKIDIDSLIERYHLLYLIIHE